MVEHGGGANIMTAGAHRLHIVHGSNSYGHNAQCNASMGAGLRRQHAA